MPSDPETLIYPFDSPPPMPAGELPAVLGGKGAGLTRMRALGLPVPPGFTIPTGVCRRVLASGWFAGLDDAIGVGLAGLEATLDRRLGDPSAPLLVSVRSGAPVSMPGMMDTVLNVGMSAGVAAALGRLSGDARFGWDTWRRFLEGYVSVVLGAPPEAMAGAAREATGGPAWADLGPDDLARAVPAWHEALARQGYEVPDDPLRQVTSAVAAVFRSWTSPRAETYRRREGIAADLGTAATVQAMVFGNLGDRSGTGVVFTRDPSTGADGLVGDFLVRAQGEDVVAGTHQTLPISELGRLWPGIHRELESAAQVLEHELSDMVDIELTVEEGRLWLLQSRVGKRSPRAALRLAVAMADDPAFPLTRAEAVGRVAGLLDSPPTATAPEGAGGVAGADGAGPEAEVLVRGLAASPGRAVGVVSLDADDAVTRAAGGQAVILVRPETSPADVHGMAEARGLVTRFGGLVSHAAVVARSWGLPAVVGAADLEIGPDGISVGTLHVPVGAEITVDGDLGIVMIGSHPATGREMPEVAVLRRWQAELEPAGGAPGDAGAGSPGPAPGPADAVPAGPEPADRPGTRGPGPAAELGRDELLRLLVLKGMATSAALAEVARAEADAVAALLEALVASGEAKAGPAGRFLLTPDGAAAAEALYAAEAEVAGPAVEAHFERFHHLNLRFKQVVTDWQMRPVGGDLVPNDHTDPAYDAGVLEALVTEIHGGIGTVIDGVSRALGRIAAYQPRFDAAVAAIQAGDLQMVAHPLKDSYHTVWFELHEELIRLAGRNRADETAAGRA